MLRFTISAPLASAALAAVVFLFLQSMLPAAWLRAVVTTVLFGSAFAAVVRYAPSAIRALSKGRHGSEGLLVVAVFTLSACILTDTVWDIARASPLIPTRSVWPIIPTFLGWMAAWATLLALIAPDVRAFPGRSVVLFAGATSVGLLLAVHPLL